MTDVTVAAPLNQGVGYGIVLGLGFGFALGMVSNNSLTYLPACLPTCLGR